MKNLLVLTVLAVLLAPALPASAQDDVTRFEGNSVSKTERIGTKEVDMRVAGAAVRLVLEMVVLEIRN